MRKLTAFTCTLFVCASTLAHAAVFMADTFSYPDGQLTASSINGALGGNVGSGLWLPHSGAIFDDNVSIISGAAQILASGSEDISREVFPAMASGETWYYAAQVTVNDTRFDATLEALNEDYFIHFKDDSFGFRGRTFLQEPNVFSTTTFTFGVTASSSNGTPPAKWATDLTFGTQYTIVQEYDFNSGNVRMWVDPVDSNSTSITDTNPNTNSPTTAINSLALRQDFTGGTANNEVLVDNVSIGDNFDEVLAALGTDVSPVLPSADADFNDDSDVDADDLDDWFGVYGGAAGRLRGDATDDGDADGEDFLEWQRQFTGVPQLSAIGVPEPASMLLLSCGLIGFAVSRRR